MKNKIQDLRNHLFETLERLKDEEDPMDIDRALAIAEVGKVIVDSAKAEAAFLKKVNKRSGTGFSEEPDINKFIEAEEISEIERPPADYSNKGHLSTVKKYSDTA